MPVTSVYNFPYQGLGDPPNGATLGQDLAQAVEDTLQADLTLGAGLIVPDSITTGGDYVTGSQAGINGQAVTSGTDDCTSATYINMAGTGAVTNFSFTKRFAGTRVRLEMAASLFSTAVTTVGKLALQLNGTDYAITTAPVTASVAHTHHCGFVYVAGIPAGTYTVQARWLKVSGAGNLRRSTDNWLSASATECN